MSGTADDLATLNQQIVDAEALSSGTYTITISADIAYASAINPISLAAGVSLIIEGDGHALNAGGGAPGLQVLTGNVTVDSLTISGAIAQGDNGAIGGGGGGAGLGGGLFVGTQADVTISDVTFTNDEAIGGTGGDGTPAGDPGDPGAPGEAGQPGSLGTGPFGVVGGLSGTGGTGGTSGGGDGGTGGAGGKGADGGSGGTGLDGIGTGGSGGSGGEGGRPGGLLISSIGTGGMDVAGGSPFINQPNGSAGNPGKVGGNGQTGTMTDVNNGGDGSGTSGFGGGGGGGGGGGAGGNGGNGGGGGGGGGGGAGATTGAAGGTPGPAGTGGPPGVGRAGGTGVPGADGGMAGAGGSGGFGAGGGGDGADGGGGNQGFAGTAGKNGSPGLSGGPGSPGAGGHGGAAGAGGSSGSGGDGGDGGANGGGGGGLGAGGDIFVAEGGHLIIEGGSLSGGKVFGGAGGSADASANAGDAGSNFGAGIFIMGSQSITLGAASGQVLTISDQISDQSGSDPTNSFGDPGAGALVISGQGTVDLAATNAFVGGTTIDSGTLELGATMAAGSGTITFAGTVDAALAFGGADVPSNVIAGFAKGDTIDLLALHETVQAYNGGTLTLVGDQTVTLDLPGNFTKASFHTAPDSGTGTNLTTDVVPCFLAGTMIATPDGEVAVERLVAGARVLTLNGQARRIVWVGTGKVLATRGRRGAATPVIVRKAALADNTPHRDLRITKGHAICIDGTLIPVEELINHRSILWDDQAQEVAIYHIELETHDVLIADGAAAESYRNDGNRWLFQNNNSGWGLSPKPPCAPILNSGPVVDAIWRRLLERAGSTRALPLTGDPDLHLLVDGQRVDAIERNDDRYVFRLAAKPRAVRVRSRSAVPQELGVARDPRSLGVALRRIVLAQARRQRAVEADSASLIDGYHAFEPPNRIRWTDGDAAFPHDLNNGINGPSLLILHIGGATQYVAEGDVIKAA